MTLLEDIQAIDLSAIVDAKASIRVAVDTDDLRRLVADGPAQRVLGDLGTALAAVQEGIDDPAALLAPLVDALGELPGLLGLHDLPLADYLDAVREGAEIMATVVGGLTGELGSFNPAGGGANLDTVLELAGGPAAEFGRQAIAGLGRFRALIDTVEAGVPSDPAALADLAIDVLLPFPRAGVAQVRAQLDIALGGLGSLGVSGTVTSGLAAALVQVKARADAGDIPGLQASLAGLARLGDEAVAALGDELRRAAQALGALHLDLTFTAMAEASGALRTAELGALEELESWRARIAEVRAMVESVDAAAGIAHAERILDLAEAEARRVVSAGVDAQLERLKAWLRGLLRELPIRELRARLSAAIMGVAAAIARAGIDAVAVEIRARVAQLADLLSSADPGALVGEAVAEIEDSVTAALDQVEAALGTIAARVNEVAAEAEAVLSAAVAGLEAFRVAIDELQPALDRAVIDQAGQQVVDNLGALREKVEVLLTAAPLPEPMRPVIEQLTATIEGIDLEAVIGQPLRAAAERLQVPDEVGATVTGGLEAVAEAVSSLIPTQLIADLEAELDAALASIGDLDLTPLTAGITDLLDKAASFLEGLNVSGAVAPASGAFSQVMEAVDRIHPRRLLQPAIDAYDRLLGSVPVPDASTVGRRAAQVTAVAGEAAARAAAQPLQQAAPRGASLAPAQGATEGGGGTPAAGAGAPPADLRVGDIVRVVGFLPAALRDGLAAIGAGPAGQALAAIDRLCGSLAADLRRLRAEVVAVGGRVEAALESAVAPVGTAQVDAQLALRARASLSVGGPGATFDLDASLAMVASVAPAALRARLGAELDLMRSRAGDAAAALTGTIAADLEAAADALEGCLLAGLAGDLDALLAALDPEPIAAELDALVVAVYDATPGLVAAIGAELARIELRVRALAAEFNPAAQAQKLLGVFDVLREELDLLNPARLADELGEVHAALRGAIAAYDPAVLAAEMDGLIDTAAVAVRELDPANLLPDLSGMQVQLGRLPDLLPVKALEGVGTQLQTVGEELLTLDVQGLLDTMNGLAPAVTDAFLDALAAVKAEILALLNAIRYAATSASASVSADVSFG